MHIRLACWSCLADHDGCQYAAGGGSSHFGGVARAQAGGALIGPHALGVIKDVEAVRHLAELGVVFLLFNIGLELSLERLRQMQKYVFGLGSAQVRAPRPPLFTAMAVCTLVLLVTDATAARVHVAGLETRAAPCGQVCVTLAVVAYTAMAVTGVSGPAAIVLGGGLALSSTAVAMQVCHASSHRPKSCCGSGCACSVNLSESTLVAPCGAGAGDG